jgi:hypothetical protein
MSTMANPEAWSSFLKSVAASNANTRHVNSGASEQQLFAAENRLKVKLPPSYRAFLSASNGWRLPSEDGLVIRVIEDARWFRKEHKDWFEACQMAMSCLNHC